MCDEKSSLCCLRAPDYRSPVKGEDEEIKDGRSRGRVVDGQVGEAHSQPELPTYTKILKEDW